MSFESRLEAHWFIQDKKYLPGAYNMYLWAEKRVGKGTQREEEKYDHQGVLLVSANTYLQGHSGSVSILRLGVNLREVFFFSPLRCFITFAL